VVEEEVEKKKEKISFFLSLFHFPFAHSKRARRDSSLLSSSLCCTRSFPLLLFLTRRLGEHLSLFVVGWGSKDKRARSKGWLFLTQQKGKKKQLLRFEHRFFDLGRSSSTGEGFFRSLSLPLSLALHLPAIMLRSMRSKLARRSNEKNNNGDKNAAAAPSSASSLDAEQQQQQAAAEAPSAGPSGRSHAAPGPGASSALGSDTGGAAQGEGRGLGSSSGPGPGPGPGGGSGDGGVDGGEASNGNGDRSPAGAAAAAAPSSSSAPSTPRGAAAAEATAAAPPLQPPQTATATTSSIANLAAARVFASPLPSFRDVTSAEKPALFLAKLRACSAVFDFGGDPTAFAREKEAKRQALLELVDYVNGGPGRFAEAAGADVVAMVSANLFRALPPRRGGLGIGAGGGAAGAGGPSSPTDGGGGTDPAGSSSSSSSSSPYVAAPVSSSYSSYASLADPEEEEPTLEPAWPHLQIVYELLLRYVVSPDTDARLARRHVDQAFVVRLLELFDSEDPRERDYLKTILHRVYGKFMSHRPFVRRSINHVFYRFVFETERHAGIAELLEILGSIINGFALPLKDEHKAFLSRALMPLHKPKCVGMYHQQLAYCVTQFVEKDARLAAPVLSSLLRYWPATNSQKEVLFLGEVEELLELTREEEFAAVAAPLFSRVARCLTSPHFQVAERALFLWNNEYVVTLVAGAREAVLPRVFGALTSNAAGHWNGAVAGLSANVRRLFQEMDPVLFDRCAAAWEQEEASRVEGEARRARQWEAVERAAEAERRRREQQQQQGGGGGGGGGARRRR